jgi:hypothetical protein
MSLLSQVHDRQRDALRGRRADDVQRLLGLEVLGVFVKELRQALQLLAQLPIANPPHSGRQRHSILSYGQHHTRNQPHVVTSARCTTSLRPRERGLRLPVTTMVMCERTMSIRLARHGFTRHRMQAANATTYLAQHIFLRLAHELAHDGAVLVLHLVVIVQHKDLALLRHPLKGPYFGLRQAQACLQAAIDPRWLVSCSDWHGGRATNQSEQGPLLAIVSYVIYLQPPEVTLQLLRINVHSLLHALHLRRPVAQWLAVLTSETHCRTRWTISEAIRIAECINGSAGSACVRTALRGLLALSSPR